MLTLLFLFAAPEWIFLIPDRLRWLWREFGRYVQSRRAVSLGGGDWGATIEGRCQAPMSPERE